MNVDESKTDVKLWHTVVSAFPLGKRREFMYVCKKVRIS